jgi:hypothetical protein
LVHLSVDLSDNLHGGHTVLARNVTRSSMVRADLAVELPLDASVESLSQRLNRFELVPQHAELKAVGFAHRSLERLLPFGKLGAQLALCELGKSGGVRPARDELPAHARADLPN